MDRPYKIQDRALLFATEVVDFCKPLVSRGGIARVLAMQLVDSGTSIGANLEEADGGQSKRDFRSKIAISRKEARESYYWLRLIVQTEPSLATQAAPLIDEAHQLIHILTAIKLNSERNDNRGE